MAYQNLDLYILKTIAGVMAKYKQKYCVMTQDKFLILLENFYDLKISKRTLNYHLKNLEEQGYIKREKRVRRKPDGTLYTLPTCYFLQEKAYHFIFRTMAVFGRFIKNTTESQKMADNYFLDYYNFTINTYKEEKKEKKKNIESSKNQKIQHFQPIQQKKKTYQKASLVSQNLQHGDTTSENYLENLKQKYAKQRLKRLTTLTDEKRQKMNDILSNKRKTTDFEERKFELLKQVEYLKQIGLK